MTRSTNMEHVPHLQRMANEAWRGSPEHAALTAAIASLSAPQPPSAPVEVEGLVADLETIWHSVSDDKETNAAYQRLKAALAQQPAAACRCYSTDPANCIGTDDLAGLDCRCKCHDRQPAALDEATVSATEIAALRTVFPDAKTRDLVDGILAVKDETAIAAQQHAAVDGVGSPEQEE